MHGKHNDIMKKIDMTFVATFIIFAFIVCCKSKESVTNVKKSDVELVKDINKVYTNDSIYVETKKFINQRNDTVFIYNDTYTYKYKYRDSIKYDGEYESHVDTLVMERYINNPQVPKKYTFSYILLLPLLALLLFIGVKQAIRYYKSRL